MSSVLITSTMKSEPGLPGTRGSSPGGCVSAAAICIVGASAEGTRGAGSAAFATGVTAVAAPAATTPVRNLRRSGFASCVMALSSWIFLRGDSKLRPAFRGPERLRELDPLLDQPALHRWPLRHAVLERGVVRQVHDRQLAPHAPDVEHEGVGVEHRVRPGEPLAPGVHPVDLLQVLVEGLPALRLDAGKGGLV